MRTHEIAATPRWLVPSFFAVAFVLYARAIGGDWVLDGALVVGNNRELANFDVARIATQDWWAGTGQPGGLYRPVSLVWLAALKSLGGIAAVDFANIALHACVAWARFELVKRLLGRTTASVWIAWLAALLALVSPLGVEVVAGQVGAADLLATLLATSAVLTGNGRGWPRALAAATLASLAVLAKENAVVVVVLAALFEFARGTEPGSTTNCSQRTVGGGAWLRTARAFAWSSAGVALALACRYAAIGSLAQVDDPVFAGFSSIARVASALAAFATYTLPLLVAPWRQLAVVGHADIAPAASFADPRALAGLALLLVLVVAPYFALRRGKRVIGFGAWLFLAAWLPTSNMLVSSGALTASRFLYFGLGGFTLLLASSAVTAWSRGALGRTFASAVIVWFGAVFACVTWREVEAWNSQRTLFELQVARAPRSPYGLVDLATALGASNPGRTEELLRRAADAPLPQVPGTSHAPEDSLETAFVARLRCAELALARIDNARAQADLEIAAQLAQRGSDAQTAWKQRENWPRQRALAWRRLAALELERARGPEASARDAALDRAELALRESENAEPDSSETLALRAQLLHERGDSSGRFEFVQRAYQRQPDDVNVRGLWAAELRQLGALDEALAIELELVIAAPEQFGADRALALGTEALASRDPRVTERGRQLLNTLVRSASTPPPIAAAATRALAPK